MTFVPSQVFLFKCRHSSRLLITLITQDTKKKVCSQGFVVMRPRQAPNPRRSNIVGATCCYLQPAASTILPDCRSGTLPPLNFCFHSKLDLPFYSPLFQLQWIIMSIYLGPQLRLNYWGGCGDVFGHFSCSMLHDFHSCVTLVKLVVQDASSSYDWDKVWAVIRLAWR